MCPPSSVASELPDPISLQNWGTGPRTGVRRRDTLGINGESVGFDQNEAMTGGWDRLPLDVGEGLTTRLIPPTGIVMRETGGVGEGGGDRVAVGAGVKRKIGSGKKSKSKRHHTDSHRGHHPRHSVTEDNVNHFEATIFSVASSSSRDVSVPHATTVGPPGLVYPAMVHTRPITVTTVGDSSRSGSMGTAGIARPLGERGSLHDSQTGWSGNGVVSATSHSDNLVPGVSGLSYYQQVPASVSGSVRARTGSVVQGSANTPNSQLPASTAPVAMPISQLASSGSTSSSDSLRLAPEFGHIRVKIEPGLSNHDSHKSPLSKVCYPALQEYMQLLSHRFVNRQHILLGPKGQCLNCLLC